MNDSPRQEDYTHGYSDPVVRHFSRRTAERDADLLLPHLRPGMRVLDFGCGVGSITVGLAAAVAPGEAVGIDIEPSMVAYARSLAQARGVGNARFEVASVYELPFPHEAFDAAFSRSVIEHLADPLAALREVRRVLRPGGVVAVDDGDYGGFVFAPADPLVKEAMDLYLRVLQQNGGNSWRGRALRGMLRTAGFSRVIASAGVTEVQGTLEETRGWGDLVAGLFLRPSFVDQVSQLGWTDQARLEQMAAAFRAWGEHPDAFWVVVLCKAIGWVE
jgi:ubiquinone/menaquinone biosynthesis C-methylase UbiE